jgi:hypothetical protein
MKSLFHFKPGMTVYLDTTIMPPFKGRFGWWYAYASWDFWLWAWRLHLTDWQYPRFLTVVEP